MSGSSSCLKKCLWKQFQPTQSPAHTRTAAGSAPAHEANEAPCAMHFRCNGTGANASGNMFNFLNMEGRSPAMTPCETTMSSLQAQTPITWPTRCTCDPPRQLILMAPEWRHADRPECVQSKRIVQTAHTGRHKNCHLSINRTT